MKQKRIYLSPPHLSGDEKDLVIQAIDSNWIAPVGPNIDALEVEFAARIGVNAAVALSSGTAAIHLALRVLDVGEGDYVFCSNFTFIASATPILFQKATPVLIDSETSSWNMSPRHLAEALQEFARQGVLPKAIIVVGLYGQAANLKQLSAVADPYGIPIIEDAAECLGAFHYGDPSGSIARMSAFSFNGNKIITGSGGGMLVSDDSSLMAKAKKLSTQAREPALHYEHKELGYNYRMSNIIAAICRGQLAVLAGRVELRQRVFEAYRQGLSDLPGIEFMPEPNWSVSTRWLTCFTVNSDYVGVFNPVSLVEFLDRRNIEARPLWKPLHMQPLMSNYRVFPDPKCSDEPLLSEHLYRRGVCLPSGSAMDTDDISRVIDAVRSFWLAMPQT